MKMYITWKYISVDEFKESASGIRTRQVAMDFDVSGQIKNLPDGRVWLEVEGKQV